MYMAEEIGQSADWNMYKESADQVRSSSLNEEVIVVAWLVRWGLDSQYW